MAKSKLLQVLGLLYKWQPEEVRDLEGDLLEQRIAIWRETITSEARKVGCNQSGNAPRLGDLSELKRMSKEDADSIAATWARDVDRELQRLFTANPRGNRQYYISNLERWAQSRARWKYLQIGNFTARSTEQYAKERFWRENDVSGFVYTGPSPVSDNCVRRMGAGVVDLNYVRRNPTPNHPNCVHVWSLAKKPKDIDCAEVWVG